MLSRSRKRYAGVVWSGKASRICCRVHAAVGWSVTFTWTTRRRSWDRMTRTNRTRKVAVGTVKKSIDAHCARCVRRKVRHVGEGDDGRLGYVDAQLLEFAVNARRAPDRIRPSHRPDQRSDIGADGRSTGPTT